MRFVILVQFYWLKLIKKVFLFRNDLIIKICERYLFKGKSWIEIAASTSPRQFLRRQKILNEIDSTQKVIFFVFREFHFLDWFTPIHRALKKQYGEKYVIIYVDFGSTLKQIGTGFNYWNHKTKIDERLINSGISIHSHFSDKEICLFVNFPNPDLIITSETIRKENFVCDHRVYLPHYSVPKEKDTLPKKIRYNHVFLPSRSPFSYKEINTSSVIPKATLHKTGYPKLCLNKNNFNNEFKNDTLPILYAPNLEVDIILDALQGGILDIFCKMDHLKFIIKFHPTLSKNLENLKFYLIKKISKISNVSYDETSSIQDMGRNSSLLITDFGSVGPEYRLGFYKRVIYLKVPKYLEGGADLRFRDQFSDGITEINELEQTIERVLKKGELSDNEKNDMIQKVLYSPNDADVNSAKTIDTILT